MTKKTVLSALALAVLAILAAWGGAFAHSARAGNGPLYEISLDPATATNDVGTDHTVTATVTISGDPLSDALVGFSVTDGPNFDASGVCSDDIGCTTDGSGQVSFTYTSDGVAGQDAIEACIVELGPPTARVSALQQLPCATATKDWVEPTPTPTPSPTATATPAQAAPAAELPETGAQPPAGADFPWLAVTVALGAFAVAGGLVLRRRAR